MSRDFIGSTESGTATEVAYYKRLATYAPNIAAQFELNAANRPASGGVGHSLVDFLHQVFEDVD